MAAVPFINSVSFGDGPDVFLGVGGWVGNWELWQRPMEALSRYGRVTAYDHYGAGLSDRDPELLGFDAQVQAVFDVLEQRGIGRCLLGGESMGGAVALAAALRAPERFSGLVLVAGHYTNFDNPTARAFAEQVRANWAGVVPGFAAVCTPEPDGERARRWLERILSAADPEAAAALMEAMYEIDLRPRLGELALPTLLVHGEQDALPGTVVATAHDAAALIPDCTLRLIPDAGHVPTLTRPEAVIAAIEDTFGDRLRGSAAGSVG